MQWIPFRGMNLPRPSHSSGSMSRDNSPNTAFTEYFMSLLFLSQKQDILVF
jgi:hypothetical protein